MPEDAGEGLQPPAKDNVGDPGAHDLESSDSEDHFSDAQTGLQDQSGLNSPVPITRVEKVDNEPSHGEVPGTDAYNTRVADARPDEIAIVPGEEDRTEQQHTVETSGPSTPENHPIPITVVEKIDPSSPSLGEVPGTESFELRRADAVPDAILKAPEAHPTEQIDSGSLEDTVASGISPVSTTKIENVEPFEDIIGSPTSSSLKSPTVNHSRRKSSSAKKNRDAEDFRTGEDGDDGAFGDDFDDFEEGDEDAEFGDFDDGFKETQIATPQSHIVQPTAPIYPALNLDDLTSQDEILAATEPYVNALFAEDTIDVSTVSTPSNAPHIFLTQRSASLWSQLVAPPPLQPPNWIRSRIRRLFLVSLGVPVDLDEILPASKQKKLILPSTSLRASFSSSRTSIDAAGGDSIARLKQDDANASNTSLDSQGKPVRSSSKRRRGPPPAPELDLVYARQLCTVTDEALSGLTIEELKEHVKKLESMQGLAKDVLEHWIQRTDEKIGDRDAFEGVIENLVKHARKVRK